jgi:hypothetical protein
MLVLINSARHRVDVYCIVILKSRFERIGPLPSYYLAIGPLCTTIWLRHPVRDNEVLFTYYV